MDTKAINEYVEKFSLKNISDLDKEDQIQWVDGIGGIGEESKMEIKRLVGLVVEPIDPALFDVLVVKLANKFTEYICDGFSTEIMEKIREINKKNNDNTCATGDFCDSNMSMDSAFSEIVGRQIDIQNELEMDIWNNAWTLAKKNDFKIQLSHSCKTLCDSRLLEMGWFDASTEQDVGGHVSKTIGEDHFEIYCPCEEYNNYFVTKNGEEVLSHENIDMIIAHFPMVGAK